MKKNTLQNALRTKLMSFSNAFLINDRNVWVVAALQRENASAPYYSPSHEIPRSAYSLGIGNKMDQ